MVVQLGDSRCIIGRNPRDAKDHFDSEDFHPPRPTDIQLSLREPATIREGETKTFVVYAENISGSPLSVDVSPAHLKGFKVEAKNKNVSSDKMECVLGSMFGTFSSTTLFRVTLPPGGKIQYEATFSAKQRVTRKPRSTKGDSLLDLMCETLEKGNLPAGDYTMTIDNPWSDEKIPPFKTSLTVTN